MFPEFSIILGATWLATDRAVFSCRALGLVRVLPYAFHVAVDRLVGVTFIIAPFVLGFSGLDAAYYWANGAVVLTVTFLLNATESKLQTVRN